MITTFLIHLLRKYSINLVQVQIRHFWILTIQKCRYRCSFSSSDSIICNLKIQAHGITNPLFGFVKFKNPACFIPSISTPFSQLLIDYTEQHNPWNQTEVASLVLPFITWACHIFLFLTSYSTMFSFLLTH